MKKILIIFLFISFLACEEIIYEHNINMDTVDLLSPSESAVLKTGVKLSFNWDMLDGAVEYKFQLAEPGFGEVKQIVLDTIIKITHFKVDSLQKGTYEWRVKAMNSAYKTGYTTNRFTVDSK